IRLRAYAEPDRESERAADIRQPRSELADARKRFGRSGRHRTGRVEASRTRAGNGLIVRKRGGPREKPDAPASENGAEAQLEGEAEGQGVFGRVVVHSGTEGHAVFLAAQIQRQHHILHVPAFDPGVDGRLIVETVRAG